VGVYPEEHTVLSTKRREI